MSQSKHVYIHIDCKIKASTFSVFIIQNFLLRADARIPNVSLMSLYLYAYCMHAILSKCLPIIIQISTVMLQSNFSYPGSVGPKSVRKTEISVT